MNFTLEEIHPSWAETFEPLLDEINTVLSVIDGSDFTPSRENIFKAFLYPKENYRVIIIGQDPYPGRGVAHGLAFSQIDGSSSVPASLRNIYKEYASDLNLPIPTTTDLSQWSERGVLLLNKSLTTLVSQANAHQKIGWQRITEAIAQAVSKDCVAILWGKNAEELSSIFPHKIISAHPSPLSARRGFFGSKPFSRANQLLINLGNKPIDWSL